MKVSLFGRFLAGTAAVLLVGSAAFAGQNGDVQKGTVQVLSDVLLNGQKLEQGSYDAEITGGSEPVLVLKSRKKEVARVAVERKELAAPSKYDRVDVRTLDGGAKEVVAFAFKNGKDAFLVRPSQKVALKSEP